MVEVNFKSSPMIFPPFSGWKYYQRLKKKAVEQEFSWPGLLLNLSIAFFIVILAALSLNLVKEALLNRGAAIENTQTEFQISPFSHRS